MLVLAILISALRVPAQSRPISDEIAQVERRLADARAANNSREVAAELIALGYLLRQSGNMQKALDSLNEALSIEQKIGNRVGEAIALNFLGRVYTDLGQEQRAIELVNKALPICRATGQRTCEANALNNLGRACNNLGQRDEALKDLNASLAIWREVDARQGSNSGSVPAQRRGGGLGSLRDASGRAGEASTLDNLGRTYSDMGEGKKAIEYFSQALAVWHEDGEQNGEALTLSNMGRAYADLGEKQRSLESYNRALALWRLTGNRQGEASTLNGIGRLYRDLSQNQKALDAFGQALPIWRDVGNRNGEALALNDTGRAWSDMGQGKKALEYFEQALSIWRETGNRRGEATTLSNMGRAWSQLGEQAKAFELDTQALAIFRDVKDRRGEAFALSSMGWAVAAQNQPEKALGLRLAALGLAKQADDPELEGGIETSLMLGFRNEHRTEEAILFGTDAVNSYQRIRRNISGLDKDLQSGFTQSKSMTYRVLAEMLVEADRLAEAEQVLDLLKEEELKEVVRGAAEDSARKLESLAMSPEQQKAQVDLENQEKDSIALIDLTADLATLQAKTNRTADETARMQAIQAKIEADNGEVTEFFRKTLYPELARRVGSQDANALLSKEKSEVSRLQNTLAELGPGVLGIRLLMGDDHAYALVVSRQARRKFVLTATPADVRNKVLQVREDLRRPSSDPKAHLAELYAMIVGPIGEELASLEQASTTGVAPTLLWSLDGILRYVPMAALYDGHKYLVERFNNVLFTPESYGHMTAAAGGDKSDLRVLAMGLSKSYGGLPALPGVLTELDAVAHDPAVPESHGPIDGHLLPDDRFTYAAMKDQLSGPSAFPVIHIASHFILETGGGNEPYLMLGGETQGQPEGFPLTLSRIEDSALTFQGTRLLTLSACSTAKGDVAKDGLEVDSLGMIAQRKDAEAVLATLWDVNDASTSRLMSDFYARWLHHPEEGKAQALRKAQLALLQGSTAAGSTTARRGVQPEREPVSDAHGGNYSHPYYWAPFVLTGNYR